VVAGDASPGVLGGAAPTCSITHPDTSHNVTPPSHLLPRRWFHHRLPSSRPFGACHLFLCPAGASDGSRGCDPRRGGGAAPTGPITHPDTSDNATHPYHLIPRRWVNHRLPFV